MRDRARDAGAPARLDRIESVSLPHENGFRTGRVEAVRVDGLVGTDVDEVRTGDAPERREASADVPAARAVASDRLGRAPVPEADCVGLGRRRAAPVDREAAERRRDTREPACDIDPIAGRKAVSDEAACRNPRGRHRGRVRGGAGKSGTAHATAGITVKSPMRAAVILGAKA
jgi:hypothetical protein